MKLTCGDLAHLGRNIPTPCKVSLDSENQITELTLLEILRIVPGKRLIALAQWGDTQVIAKVFYHPRHWPKNRLRDLKGVNYLRAHDLPAPDLIHQTTTAESSGAVLLFKYLANGITLSELFDDPNSQFTVQQQLILKNTVETLCHCHDKGIWQEDVHLDNFMLAGETIYLLDGGDIRSKRTRMTRKHRMENLARFVCQFPVSIDSHLPEILSCYSSNTEVADDDDQRQFSNLVKKLRNQLLDHYESKVFRSTTAYKRVKTISKRFVYDRGLQSKELFQFIENPDSFIDKSKVIKDGDTTTVVEVTINNTPLILKRYNIVSFWQGARRLFQVSRAHHSWRNATMLLMLGIATPKPYLFLEERRFWFFKRRAYFLSEHVGEMNLLLQLESEEAEEVEKGLASKFHTLFEIFHQYKISHGDTKATNFIIRNNRLFVLDLDAMKRHSQHWFYKRKAIKDLNRFKRNWAGSRLASTFNPVLDQLRLKP